MIIVYLLLTVFYSTALYWLLQKKTRVSLHYLYKDNLLVILLSFILLNFTILTVVTNPIIAISFILISVPMLAFLITIVRFYRSPIRKVNNEDDGIVSPADGNIIYIKQIEQGEEPISVKNGKEATLFEFANTGVIDRPCWLIGINMTPFDVHKNCAPVEGKIVLIKHFNGEFLSLKHEEALRRNERNTIVIDTPKGRVGVVQTASRLVRRIISYKKENDFVTKGEWFGMIKFGSQVDLIIPASCKVMVAIGQQVYAKQTIIAKWESDKLE